MKLKPSLVARYALYEAAVQSVEFDVEFIDRIYRKRRGQTALRLREDFCGTFSLCCAWARSHREREAFGVDLAAEPLAYGKKNHWGTLPSSVRDRVSVKRQDVRTGSEPVDVIVAQNFSYFCFHEREQLREYFRACWRSLHPGGIFCLDIFGGPETECPQTDRHRVRPKGYQPFQYFWELRSFNPLDRRADYRIHFQLSDGRWLRNAFRYDWRMWTVPEVREILMEAGFRKTELLWEEDNGVYRPKTVAENDPAWLAYIIASR